MDELIEPDEIYGADYPCEEEITESMIEDAIKEIACDASCVEVIVVPVDDFDDMTPFVNALIFDKNASQVPREHVYSISLKP